MTETLPILALVRDLIFTSKITAEARAQGATIKMIARPELVAGQSGRLLIVDLNLPGAIPAAAAWAASTGQEVIGFVSHLDAAAITQAREAGLANVMARSRFVQILPQLLAPKSNESAGPTMGE